MQLTYALDPDVAYAGLPVNAELEVIESAIALESMNFGYAALRADNADHQDSVRTARRNQVTLVFSADIITSNSIAGTVNGVALTATVFATDHATTMAALGAKIVALLAALATPIVATATVGGASNRTLTIDAEDGSLLAASFVITAGSSQATITITNQTSDLAAQFLGILRFSNQPPRRSDGLAGFAAGDAVPVVRRGIVWVPITSDVAEGAAAYIDYTAGNEGKFTDVTTAPNLAVPTGIFRKAAVASGLSLAQLEINLP